MDLPGRFTATHVYTSTALYTVLSTVLHCTGSSTTLHVGHVYSYRGGLQSIYTALYTVQCSTGSSTTLHVRHV